MKKILRVELIAEMEIDTTWYDDQDDESIIKSEKEIAHEWAFSNIVKERYTLKNVGPVKKVLDKMKSV
jgi:hypothetical protein